MMKTIVLADDHEIMREGLRLLLEKESDFRVIGEAGEGLQAVRLAESHRPDVLVVDMVMSGLNGIEVTRRVRKCSPETKVVILSMYGTEGYVVEALRAGVLGYVLKEASGKELVHAVREALSGRRYLSKTLSEQAIEAYAGLTQPLAEDAYDSLTVREREILQMLGRGLTRKQIAAQLYISQRTYDSHCAKMKRKLGLSKHAELLLFAGSRQLQAAKG